MQAGRVDELECPEIEDQVLRGMVLCLLNDSIGLWTCRQIQLTGETQDRRVSTLLDFDG